MVIENFVIPVLQIITIIVSIVGIFLIVKKITCDCLGDKYEKNNDKLFYEKCKMFKNKMKSSEDEADLIHNSKICRCDTAGMISPSHLTQDALKERIIPYKVKICNSFKKDPINISIIITDSYEDGNPVKCITKSQINTVKDSDLYYVYDDTYWKPAEKNSFVSKQPILPGMSIPFITDICDNRIIRSDIRCYFVLSFINAEKRIGERWYTLSGYDYYHLPVTYDEAMLLISEHLSEKGVNKIKALLRDAMIDSVNIRHALNKFKIERSLVHKPNNER